MTTLLQAPPAASGISHWTIDPTHSRVTFTLRQFMLGTLRGSVREIGGVVRTVDGDARVHIDVQIPVAGVHTGAPRRDAVLRSAAFFDAVCHPTISFVGRRIRGDRRGMFSVDGDLTMRGKTRDIILQATAQQRTFDEIDRIERVTFHATTRIDRRDFGILAPNAIEMGGLVIGRDVRIDIELDLIRAMEPDAWSPEESESHATGMTT